ncbi:metal ABC transporter solute-binding protein, Zn/Mn family [Leptothoe kymatousa]|uniref:Zinc ABC transporter substrate-binding protein n=1 Tax=Leptothoe kymatousa TAU-MAC 1615 TaxID=2364775 RepID=A0ABS5Y4D8_9CYAN|nr:zinc ABC transporter substrate-binding protein [Leptothoe kymatousa]MBT9312224.1 zinc ABC transporter substrate-binding protein [Leptothoe kymatousa TAU-MAC 1615]
MEQYFSQGHGVVSGALALLIGLAGCTGSAPTTNQPEAATAPKDGVVDASQVDVIASYSVICDIAAQIVADAAQLNCLIPSDQDPHTYQAKPSDREAIDTADLVFYAGLNFEPAIIDMATASDSEAPKIALHDEAVQQLIEVVDDGEVSPDPHIWHDIENGLAMVNIIRDNLVAVDPDNADAYSQNAEQLADELQTLDAWIPEQIATIPASQRRLITTHDAMGYYAQAYGLTVEGTLLGMSTEEQPTATQVNVLAKSIRDKAIPTIFAELTADDRVLKTVAGEAGVSISEKVLLADGLGPAGTPQGTYTGMLVYNTCTIVEGLGGKCAPTP